MDTNLPRPLSVSRCHPPTKVPPPIVCGGEAQQPEHGISPAMRHASPATTLCARVRLEAASAAAHASAPRPHMLSRPSHTTDSHDTMNYARRPPGHLLWGDGGCSTLSSTIHHTRVACMFAMHLRRGDLHLDLGSRLGRTGRSHRELLLRLDVRLGVLERLNKGLRGVH